MEIIFMGTPEFAVPSLRELIHAGHNIKLVVTQPDRKGNRGKLVVPPVKMLALEHGIDVAQPDKIKKEESLIARMRSISPDLIVVAAFGQILPSSVLEIPKFGCINVHGSLLPRWRGAAPMQYALLYGDETTGVTIMNMEEGLDTGDMIASCEIVTAEKRFSELSNEISEKGAKLLVETISKIADGTAVYTKQDDANATYARQIRKEDGLTSFDGDAISEYRKMRAYEEWPTLYSYLGGQQIKFFDAEVIAKSDEDLPDEFRTLVAGQVFGMTKNNFCIKCGNGALMVKELQRQGKRRMSAADFLKGTKLTTENIFTNIKEES